MRGREEILPRVDPDAREVQAIRVPARSDRHLLAHKPVRVQLHRVAEEIQLPRRERKRVRRRELARVAGGTGAVPGVVALVLAAGVVQEPEAEDDRAIWSRVLAGEPEAARGDAAPVLVAVEVRVALLGAGESRVQERRVEHGDSLHAPT